MWKLINPDYLQLILLAEWLWLIAITINWQLSWQRLWALIKTHWPQQTKCCSPSSVLSSLSHNQICQTLVLGTFPRAVETPVPDSQSKPIQSIEYMPLRFSTALVISHTSSLGRGQNLWLCVKCVVSCSVILPL